MLVYDKWISNKCFFRYRNIICYRTKKFDEQISTFGTNKAAYLSNINISMRLRHLNLLRGKELRKALLFNKES